jgi:aminopeptidase N
MPFQVIDTDATFLTFDGITYGKGASLLKQLVFTIGQDAFQEGMRYYFSKYAWGNTTIVDFLEVNFGFEPGLSF